MSNFKMLQPCDNKLVMLQNSFQLYSSMLRLKCNKPMNVIDVNIEHDHIINEWNSFAWISIHDFVVHF
jgi:hypothetical protein